MIQSDQHAFGPSTFCGRIGVARRDITPPQGIYARNWGAAAADHAEGVHRPLTATVLAIFGDEADAPPLLLIAVDFCSWRSPADEARLRSPILEQLALDPSRLMIALSHTHSSPSISVSESGQPGGHLIQPYVERLVQTLVDAACHAIAEAEAATLTWRYGRCDLATNRDLPDPDHPDRHLVGFHPGAPADDTLLVGAVHRDRDGRFLATIVNYACHPTTLAWDNRLISPDYVGAMREVVESATGGAPCLFLQGASGELAPAEQYTGAVAVADRHGHRLGYAILATLHAMLPPRTSLRFRGAKKSGADLAVWTRDAGPTTGTIEAITYDVPLPLKPRPTVGELEQQLRDCQDRALHERLRRRLHQVRGLPDGSIYSMPAWAWRIGDALLFGHPNEAYSRWQTTLRAAWPDTPVVAMNVTNGSVAYLVPADRCAPGLYASWQTPFDRDALSILTDASLKAGQILLQQHRAANE